MVTPVQDDVWGDTMRFRRYFLHYRAIRQALTFTVTIGTAVLLSYLILQARL